MPIKKTLEGYCKENKIPYFGLCYGMQLMTVEFARNVAGLEDANTTEINPNAKHPTYTMSATSVIPPVAASAPLVNANASANRAIVIPPMPA